MISDSRLARQTAERLIGSRAHLLKFPCLLGFDGFVEESCQIVKERSSPSQFALYSKIKEFGAGVISSSGQNALFETIPQAKKLSGQGPMLSFALSTLGVPITYVGMLGYPEIHPVFSELAKRTKVYSIAQPAFTQSFDFSDGKLQFAQEKALQEISWDTIQKRLGDQTLQKIWMEARFIGMVNWSRLPHLSAFWKRCLHDYKPSTAAGRKGMFFDLGDPADRLDADLTAALKIIGEFQEQHDVTLSLNENESEQVAKVLRLKKLPSNPKGTASLASAIREKAALHTVVIHSTHYAAGADAQGEVLVTGPYTDKPKVTTGAGNHFNSGLVVGRLLNLSLAHSLQLAVAASGYYVRHAVSPNREQLVRFLQTV